jgi:hypothetical protein
MSRIGEIASNDFRAVAPRVSPGSDVRVLIKRSGEHPVLPPPYRHPRVWPEGRCTRAPSQFKPISMGSRCSVQARA